MDSLSELVDEIARKLFGITKTQAHQRRVCIRCKRSVDRFKTEMDELDKEEYKITGLCPDCYVESCEILREAK